LKPNGVVLIKPNQDASKQEHLDAMASASRIIEGAQF